MPGDAVSAQVVSKDFTEFFRVTRLVLDKGARDVRPHIPVVAPDGVVGSVLHVAGDTVDVQLAVDALLSRLAARFGVRHAHDPIADRDDGGVPLASVCHGEAWAVAHDLRPRAGLAFESVGATRLTATSERNESRGSYCASTGRSGSGP